ncbi:hypothetical protein ACQEVY_00815 [Streptomyces sp. CA-288835]|uniref:hypothetical protein n=1 Tax=Streptomyces sp. CA-288835 TaxID=3240069 RepID=UPI003D900281
MGGAVVRHLHAHTPHPQKPASHTLQAGRWIEAEHPEAADPADWTRKTCATWVAAVDRMRVGDYLQRTASLTDRLCKPMEAPSKAGHLTAVRTFFRDLQEWELIPRRFDPQRALGTPRSIAACSARTRA